MRDKIERKAGGEREPVKSSKEELKEVKEKNMRELCKIIELKCT